MCMHGKRRACSPGWNGSRSMTHTRRSSMPLATASAVAFALVAGGFVVPGGIGAAEVSTSVADMVCTRYTKLPSSRKRESRVHPVVPASLNAQHAPRVTVRALATICKERACEKPGTIQIARKRTVKDTAFNRLMFLPNHQHCSQSRDRSAYLISQ